MLENQHKRSIRDDVSRLKGLMPWIGHIALDRLHMGVLQPWIGQRRSAGVAAGTINQGLQIVRRILNLAASEWMDEQGLTWLHAVPKIKLLPNHDKRMPYPLDWDEQARLFRELPDHLADMALFAVNTGCRDSEICSLRWEWMVEVPELGNLGLHRSGHEGEERRRTARGPQSDCARRSSTADAANMQRTCSSTKGSPCSAC